MAESTYTSDEIRAEIKKLVGRVTEREPEEVPDNAHYLEELGVDSLMAIEVMIAMDRKFGIDIPEEEFQKATNVNESVELIERWLAERVPATAS
jgi:acyl carrier protein